jgi:hypothetical protein
LNSRPPVPQTGALTELRYAPTLVFQALHGGENKNKAGVGHGFGHDGHGVSVSVRRGALHTPCAALRPLPAQHFLRAPDCRVGQGVG